MLFFSLAFFLILLCKGGESFLYITIINLILFILGALAFYNSKSRGNINLPLDVCLLAVPSILYCLSGSILYFYWSSQLVTSSGSATLKFLINQLTVLSFVFLLSNLDLRREKIKSYIKIIIISSMVVALIGITTYIFNLNIHILTPQFPWHNTIENVVHGTFSYKNQFGIFLTVSVILLLSHDSFPIKSPVKIMILSILVLTILYCKSRSSILLLIGGLVFLYIRNISFNNIFENRIKSIALLISIIVTVLVISRTPTVDRLLTIGFEDGGRLDSYLVAFDTLIGTNIWTGSGPGTYEDIRNTYKTVESTNNSMYQWVHNDYLQILATHGIIGSIFFAMPYFFLIYQVFKRRSFTRRALGLKISFSVLLVHSLFDYSLGLYFLNILMLTLGIFFISYSHYQNNCLERNNVILSTSPKLRQT